VFLRQLAILLFSILRSQIANFVFWFFIDSAVHVGVMI